MHASVSVIIPAYNARQHIGDALDSVFAQNIAELEVIVVDDGSRDETAEFVARQYPSVHLLRKENGGAATARNAGMRWARGAVIAFLDADDVWLPGKLAAQMRHLAAHPEIGLVCTRFAPWYADAHGRFPPPAALATQDIPAEAIDPERSGWLYHKLLLACIVWTSTVVMRRSLMAEIGEFDTELRLGQDYDYWLRASRLTQIHTLQRTFALYRQHDHSATARGADTNYGALVLSRALARWGCSSPNGESVPRRRVERRIAGIHCAQADLHWRRGQHDLALRACLAALRHDPWHWGAWRYLPRVGWSAVRQRLSARLGSS